MGKYGEIIIYIIYIESISSISSMATVGGSPPKKGKSSISMQMAMNWD